MSIITLRDYQVKGVNDIRKNIRAGHQVICFQGPTAMGKTRIFSYITHGAAQKNNSVWILVHRKELLKQASKSIGDLGVNHGLISPSFTSTFDPVQIASIDTLKNRYLRYSPPQLIIVDEFHHCISPTWRKVLDYYISRGTIILGFSATPNRLDGKGLGKQAGGICDSLVLGPQPQILIDGGYLAAPRIFCPNLASPEGLRSKFGEYKRDEVDAMMDKPMIIGDAVKQYSKICPNRPTICFVPSLRMGEHVQEQYRAAGYQATMVDGTLDDRERERRLTDLGGGKLHVLISCQLIDEGVDVPTVEVIQMLNPTQSTAKFLQQAGRGARMFPGKQGYYLLDHVCNTFYQDGRKHHGDPAEDREWTLDGEIKRKGSKTEDKSIPMKQCEQCYCCHPPAPACPMCGFVYQVSAREIEQAEGELVEFDRKRLEEIEEQRRKLFLRREEGRCSSLEDFQSLAKERGYKPGWARFRWEARQNRGGARA